MYHRSKVRWQSGPLSGLWNDRGFYCTTFPEIVGALQLCRFPHWPPNNLSSRGAHRELLHRCLLILCQLDKSEWEEVQSMGSFHMVSDNALSGKFVRTMRLSVTSAIDHGNFVRFSGVLICYCFITPSKRQAFESLPRGVFSNRVLSPQKSTWRLRLHCCDLVLKSIS